jgi:hypothetical protein
MVVGGHLSLMRQNHRLVYRADPRLSNDRQNALLVVFARMQCGVVFALQDGDLPPARQIARGTRELVQAFGVRFDGAQRQRS